MNERLLTNWRKLYDEKQAATAELRAQLADLETELCNVSQPFDAQLTALEAEIRTAALPLAKTYKALDIGVEVAYRKGSTRVTYKWQAVDQVRNVLRDILPETAASLDAARTETTGEPSVSVKAL